MLEFFKEPDRTCLRIVHPRDSLSLEWEGGWEHLSTDPFPIGQKMFLGVLTPGTSRLHMHEYETGSAGEPCQQYQRCSLEERDNSILQLRPGAVRLHLWEAGCHGDGWRERWTERISGGVYYTPSSGHRPLKAFWGQASCSHGNSA